MFLGISLVLFLLFCTCLYHICMHYHLHGKGKLPPGPVGLPVLGYLPFLGKVPYVKVSKLSKNWGPVITLWLGQFPVVFINEFDKIKPLYKLDVMTGRAQLTLFEKRGVYGLGLLEGEDWKEVRRFLLRFLRDSGFGKHSMEASIQEELSIVINSIRKKLGEPVYLKPLIEISMINALWFILTSEKYDMEDPVKREVVEVMSEGLANQNLVGIAAFLPWLARLLPGYSGYGKALKYFDAPNRLAEDVIQKHVATHREGSERDVIDHILTKIYNTANPKSMFYKEVGMKNLHYSLIDIWFAGSDTMSSTLGWAFLYLSLWPEKQEKVQDEIDRQLGHTMPPSVVDRQRMPFTEATMYEVMRMSSMVPLGLLHRNLETVHFEGYTIPAGTFFLANLYHVFHDPEYWGDPESFRPERFLSEDGIFTKDERLIPFFTGKRTCIGESLALNEYFIFFTGLLQNFTFSLDKNNGPCDIGPRSGFILPPPKHKLLITERNACK